MGVMRLGFAGALGVLALASDRLSAQMVVDTSAIAHTVVRALRQQPGFPPGPFIVDSAAVGARYLVAAMQRNGLRARAVANARSPSCKESGQRGAPGSPFLAHIRMDSVTAMRAIVLFELRCREERGSGAVPPGGDFQSQTKVVVRRGAHGWVTRGPYRVTVT